MTTLRPIARSTYTPALAKASNQGDSFWTSDSGGTLGRTIIRVATMVIPITMVAERCCSAKLVIRARGDIAGAGLVRAVASALMLDLRSACRGCPSAGR